MKLIEDTVELQSNEPDVAEIEEVEYDGEFQIVEAQSELLEGISHE